MRSAIDLLFVSSVFLSKDVKPFLVLSGSSFEKVLQLLGIRPTKTNNKLSNKGYVFSWWAKKKVPKTIPSTTLPSCFVAWHTWHFLFLVCLTKRKLPNCFSFSSFYLSLQNKTSTNFSFFGNKTLPETAWRQSWSKRFVWPHKSCWSERIL